MTSPLRTFLISAITAFALMHSSVLGYEKPSSVYVEVEIEYDTGKVTDAHLSKSTGDPILDAATLEKFRKWRFKPKKVRRVRIPIQLATDKK
jgi:TonB family protein